MNWKEKVHPAFGRSLYADNGVVELIIPLTYGIRIGHFSFIGDENVFFEQPSDMKELTTDDGWRIRGGHRLWLAPESEGDVSYETYFCYHMAEIESLSPLYTVAPGESAEHQETWKLFRAE